MSEPGSTIRFNTNLRLRRPWIARQINVDDLLDALFKGEKPKEKKPKQETKPKKIIIKAPNPRPPAPPALRPYPFSFGFGLHGSGGVPTSVSWFQGNIGGSLAFGFGNYSAELKIDGYFGVRNDIGGMNFQAPTSGFIIRTGIGEQSGSAQYIGISNNSSGIVPREVGGVQYGGTESSSLGPVFFSGTGYSKKFFTGKGSFFIEPGLMAEYGVLGNRLLISGLASVRVGWQNTQNVTKEIEPKLSTEDVVFYLWSVISGTINKLGLNFVLADPFQRLSSTLPFSAGGAGKTDLNYIYGAMGLLGTFSPTLSLKMAMRTPSAAGWLFLLGEIASAITMIAVTPESDSAKSSGVSTLINTVSAFSLYAAFGLLNHKDRAKLTNEQLKNKFQYAALIRYLIGVTTTVIGGFMAASNPSAAWFFGAGAQSAANAAGTPLPSDRLKGMLIKFGVGYGNDRFLIKAGYQRWFNYFGSSVMFTMPPPTIYPNNEGTSVSSEFAVRFVKEGIFQPFLAITTGTDFGNPNSFGHMGTVGGLQLVFGKDQNFILELFRGEVGYRFLKQGITSVSPLYWYLTALNIGFKIPY